MAHGRRDKAKAVSASSLFDLKAEISKQESEFARNKAAGKSRSVVGGVKRPDKKPTVWTRQNKGVGDRASRDIELEAVSKPTLESARAALERKAKIYDQLQKGKTGGLNDKQYDALLVDFDSKPPPQQFDPDSDDIDESLEVPRAPHDDTDPVIEYEDEFGRIRTAHRSEVPRNLMPPSEDEAPDEDEDIIIRNPVGHFPVYEPSTERVAEIAKAHAEENNPLGVHYDAAREVRAKGAGFYQFSADEEKRHQQMEELKSARHETEKMREEKGAVDIRPGEIEGMQDGDTTSTVKSRAMEKRKRDLEERRKLLDAKRRKMGHPVASSSQLSQPPPITQASAPREDRSDPFTTLEASQGKENPKAPLANDAERFLAQLQEDILNGRGK